MNDAMMLHAYFYYYFLVFVHTRETWRATKLVHTKKKTHYTYISICLVAWMDGDYYQECEALRYSTDRTVRKALRKRCVGRNEERKSHAIHRPPQLSALT